MDKVKVVEKDNPNAVHCPTWSRERAQQWIDRYGDSGIFTDKTLDRDSFEIVEPGLGLPNKRNFVDGSGAGGECE